MPSPSHSSGADVGPRSVAKGTARAESNGEGHTNVTGPLSATQQEIIELCADAAYQLGFARSLGQIFGVIYASPEPLAFADVVERLGISNGSASTGIRILRELGAIKPVAGEADPRELFVAETELRKLLAGILETRLRAPLAAGAGRLKAMEERLESASSSAREPDLEFLRQRVASLQTWRRKALLFLPMVQTFVRPRSRKG